VVLPEPATPSMAIIAGLSDRSKSSSCNNCG
jgi:hypothetical protein